MGWLGFGLAFVAFFVSHSIPVRPPVKRWFVARIGTTGFTLAYAILSVGVLAWLVVAADRAPFIPLWDRATWQVYVPLVVMLPVCLILMLSIGRPNPFSFGGSHDESFDPTAPGIVRITRHPLLLAGALWATAHIVPNGDLAHVILFGTFTGFALIGRTIIDRRKKREMGARWEEMLNVVGNTSLISGVLSGCTTARVAGGVALYVVLIAAHPILLGASPLP